MATVPEFKVIRLTVAGTLTDRVSGTLVELISRGDFLPGSRLPSELEMARRFGVSRTVIREAVSRLKSEGLVETRQGSGVFVREKNMDLPFRINPKLMESIPSFLQVVELRHVLEGEIAALAAKRCTDAQLASIQQALKKIESDISSGGDGVDADIAFHTCIAEAVGNPHFLALTRYLVSFLRGAAQTTCVATISRTSSTRQVKDEHLAIVEAISKKDSEAARMAAQLHWSGFSSG